MLYSSHAKLMLGNVWVLGMLHTKDDSLTVLHSVEYQNDKVINHLRTAECCNSRCRVASTELGGAIDPAKSGAAAYSMSGMY